MLVVRAIREHHSPAPRGFASTDHPHPRQERREQRVNESSSGGSKDALPVRHALPVEKRTLAFELRAFGA